MSEFPKCYVLVKRQARKDHKCCECHGVIRKGETYNYHSGVWDGSPASYKVCVDCDALRARVVKDCDLFDDEIPALTCLGDDLEFDHRDEFEAIKAKRKDVQP